MEEQSAGRAKVMSPQAASSFQTTEPVVSRAQKMRDCFDQVEMAASARKQQAKAHSPEFYSSKANFMPQNATYGPSGQHSDVK